jgi:hypothetical protein
MKWRIRYLEEGIAAYKSMGDADSAAWYEWQREGLMEVLEDSSRGVPWLLPHDANDAYKRRSEGLMDAYHLVRDQAFIEEKKAALLEDPDLGSDFREHDPEAPRPPRR